MIVAVALFFLQQLSGINAVIYYAPEIFNHAGFASGETRILATVGIGTVNFATTVLAMFLIDRLGRRPLLVLGFAGAAATMLIIALAVTNPTLVPSWLVIAHAAALHRLLRDRHRAAAARHDVGDLPAAGARPGHEHGVDQQLGLQLRGGLRLPA